MSTDDKESNKSSDEALKKAEIALEVEQDARAGKVKAEAKEKGQGAVKPEKALNKDG